MIIAIFIIISIIIGIFVINFFINRNKSKNVCSECGTNIADKNLRECPKCGNPIK